MKSATQSAEQTLSSSEDFDVSFPIGGIAKRSFDMTSAALALLIFSPIFLLIAVLVKLSDPGPIFYGHRRVGHNGRYFHCLKFRTMAMNGDEILRQYLAANPEAAEEWRATRKLKNDPRVTAVGAVLRKLSLDELPQLLNIIRGEMSVVGPRPVVDEELSYYESAAAYYLSTRPGLTGLWQISGRNDVSYKTRVAFDTHYVQNWSMRQDVFIIVKTIPAVCLSRGSY
ncbi:MULTISPECIES: sugar transferase [Agrobacterium]|uniref:Sugar transferase n=1 Tax=Agrobacterium salinitolerans TaxID=1183413 RepID=A0A1S9EEF8_9HYPH|nr:MULTISPECIES: sugar transferase [Agrobacterium]MBA4775923.1 sugar transferase [Hyphomicrobiales bacterium]PNQ22134.1 exopolysaccharide biosynthesis protein [Rhizobium sp. YIC5082]MCZ7852407.1 sugar transferase [Agrobacterium salinitolerans]MCZ7859234.1 sugar transferase [Agrobacterium salinitolerans]MCZ7863779.1 sugar transferase [Agrobacterium salinitolerans]